MAIRTLTLTFVVALCLYSQSYAQTPQCNNRDAVLNLLSNKYKEAPVAFGVANNGALVEVLKSVPSAKHDTWTIIITTPQGVSCLVAAGEGWKAVTPVSRAPAP